MKHTKSKTCLIVNRLFLLFVLGMVFSTFANASAKDNYAQFCASCHGKQMQGGLAQPLRDNTWKNGGQEHDIINSIKDGIPELGMPSWKGKFSDHEIKELAIYILGGNSSRTKPKKTKHRISFEKILDTVDGEFWSIEFLNNTDFLVTEIDGRLWLYENGHAKEIKGTPKVWRKGQGGLLSVAIHPDYKKNGWIYLSYSAKAGDSSLFSREHGMTKVVRGKIKSNRWQNQETLFEANVDLHSPRGVHFGSRFVFKDGYLFFGIGDRGYRELAQDLSRPNGKIFRLHDDGRIPKDNPFVNTASAMPEIWSYGHRNPQGMVLDPITNQIWESEHGPRGGDELNIIEKGRNYGWPVITYGKNYSGTSITDITEKEGMEQPVHYWVPSIATSGIEVYRGDVFPNWQGHILVGGLAAQALHLVEIEDNKAIKDRVIFSGKGRVRDVKAAPDGTVYVLLSNRSDNTAAIYQIRSE